MSKAVICIVPSSLKAQLLVDELRMCGFSRNDISLLMADEGSVRDLAVEKHSKAPEGTAIGAGLGALAGGVYGGLVGFGYIAAPTADLLAAGPLLATLACAGLGSALGGIFGGLIGFATPEYEAKQYEGKLAEGKILLSIHAINDVMARNAERILKDGGVNEVYRVVEESVGHHRAA